MVLAPVDDSLNPGSLSGGGSLHDGFRPALTADRKQRRGFGPEYGRQFKDHVDGDTLAALLDVGDGGPAHADALAEFGLAETDRLPGRPHSASQLRIDVSHADKCRGRWEGRQRPVKCQMG